MPLLQPTQPLLLDWPCVSACRTLVGESWTAPHKLTVWDMGQPLTIASLPEANWPERCYSKGPTQPHISPDGEWPLLQQSSMPPHASSLSQPDTPIRNSTGQHQAQAGGLSPTQASCQMQHYTLSWQLQMLAAALVCMTSSSFHIA